MRKYVLYIAMSIDGYIADQNGGVDWLRDQENSNTNMGSYPEFIKTVDTVLMGYTTFHQIAAELFSDTWPYDGMQTYVLTHRQLEERPEILFTSEPVEQLAKRLQKQEGKDIWICGGADLVRQFVQADLIDRYHFTVIPTLLGRGIRLFPGGFQSIPLKLISSASYQGMTDLVYEKR